ncbi:MAG: Hsp20/alpha crystallin family protein [Spirochaetaceae bacterium]|nr:Hsp20/alpha crystallin family protein [Spirochaetaceae bacterium]
MKSGTMYYPVDSVKTLVDIDRLVDSFFGTNQRLNRENTVLGHFPLVDICEKSDSYVLEAELPGYNENDVEVNLNGGTLTIESKKDESLEKQDEAGNYVVKERRIQNFTRSFKLPENADPSSIEADFKDGLLCLTIKKRTEAQKKIIEFKKKSE